MDRSQNFFLTFFKIASFPLVIELSGNNEWILIKKKTNKQKNKTKQVYLNNTYNEKILDVDPKSDTFKLWLRSYRGF